MKASIYTLGCRVNQYESEAISESLKRAGFEIVKFGDEADITIINSCTVTSESDRKSKQFTRRAQTISPNGKVILTGCLTDSFPEEAKKTNAIIISNADKNKISSLALKLCGKVPVTDNTFNISKPRRARTFVKIEDGCDNKCAYCIIPKARGKIISRSTNDILEEIRTITSAGCPEIILTGIETASFGKDLTDTSLIDLMEKVNNIAGVKRFTLGSLDPTIMKDEFINRLVFLDKLLPHFHLSIQAGSTNTLNKMRRKYTAEKALSNISNLKSRIKDVTLSADIIVGFPGETEEDFAETIDFCKKAEFLHLHIFPYSKRAGTEAVNMDNQVPENIKHLRASELEMIRKEIQNKILDNYIIEHQNKPAKVLVEKWIDGISFGHSEHFIECRIKTNCDMTGKIIEVIPENRTDDILNCKIKK